MIATIIGIAVIAAIAVGGLWFGIPRPQRAEPEPVEHGDGEPVSPGDLDAWLARLEHGEPGP